MAKIVDLEEQAQSRQMVLVALGVLGVAMLLSLLYFTFFKTSYAVLFSKLRPADAAAVVTVLQKDKTPYRLTDKGTTILVPDEQVDASRLNVVSADIPLKGAVGFELFNKSDMGLTDFAQKINYQRALQGELARTIMTLNGVDSARVHLSLPEQTIFQHDSGLAKASVTVVMQFGSVLSPAAVGGIQHLVASAVADLNAGDVVVLDAQGEVISSPPLPSAPMAPPVVQQKLAIEQYYAGRIRAALQDAGLSDPEQVSVLALLGPVYGSTPQLAAPDREGLPSDKQGDVFSESFSPQGRQFGLRTVINVAQTLSQDDRLKVIDAIRAAISFDARKGDDIAFGLPTPTPPPVQSIAEENVSASHNAIVPSDATAATSYLILAGFIAALFTAAAMLVGWLWWNRRLSNPARQAFAAQLTQALVSLDSAT